MTSAGVLPADVITRRAAVGELAPLLARIEQAYGPDDVLLFGSRARGTADAGSDWDLLVVLADDADEALLDPMLAWNVQHGSGVHADIVCARRSAFLADLTAANTLPREIADHAIGLLPG